ncbi:MAG: hypothetical protein ABI234_06235, partial [Ktedonobacteraceae bacterium]
MAPTYYFSGVNKPELLAVLGRQHACGMLNALSAGQPKLRRAYERYPVELVLDSGAVQGNQNIVGYARLIKLIGARMTWIANLDSLHNQQASDENFRHLQALLADEVLACTKLLWIYQCQSCGDHWDPDGDLDLLKRALDHHRFIGLGGILSVVERDIQHAQNLLGTLGEILDAAGAQAHIFGIGNYPLLTYCLTQRWFRSADSARWLQGLRSRMLLTVDGKVLSGKRLTFTGLQ